MAITKIKVIKGNLRKSLGQVIDYATNKEKTVAQYDAREMQSLRDVMDYATQTAKTDIERFVTGVNCDPVCARDQMIMVKEKYGKMDGRCAYHSFQSFKPGEVTPELAHEIGVALAREIWGDKYQIVVATHLDKMHIHNHFVMNSVSFVDGHKFRDSYDDYYNKMRAVSDRLCAEHGLSVIDTPQRAGKQYGEWQAEGNGQPTWRSLIRDDVDEAITQASTMTQFVAALKAKGYTVKAGNVKYLAVRPPGKERFVRLRSLGDSYTEDAIIERIMLPKELHKILPKIPPRDPTLPPPLPVRKRGRYNGSFAKRPRKKLKGLRALYVRYLYMLGAIPKRRSSNKRMAFLLREDLYKLNGYIGQMKLLHREHIDTLEQLDTYKETVSARIDGYIAERTDLHRLKRREPNESIRQSLTDKAAAISSTLKTLRRELRWCDEISENSTALPERLARASKVPESVTVTKDHRRKQPVSVRNRSPER